MRKPHPDPGELRRLLAQRDAEGLTFNQLAERSGVPVHVLHHRSRTDARRAKLKEAKECAFVEVRASEPSASSCIELVLPQGMRVRLEPNFNQATLARLLSTVAC
jgi:hypothetical protein